MLFFWLKVAMALADVMRVCVYFCVDVVFLLLVDFLNQQVFLLSKFLRCSFEQYSKFNADG
jgi:hypothetical protein